MNGYNIKPIFASSTMNVGIFKNKIKFSNNIIYDYIDLKDNPDWKSYKQFLEVPKNYEEEISIYWNNLQLFLDEEQNLINHKEVLLNVQHCGIQFRDDDHPFVQWIVEFEGEAHSKTNIYENKIEKETLEYPIYSLYIFDKNVRVMNVETSLTYEISPNRRVIEYFGKKGDNLNGYEKITFLKSD